MNTGLSLLIIFVMYSFLNPIQCINSTLECSSSNDPHIINFKKVPFEFHYGGIYPLYESIYVKVSAGFKKCSPSSKAFCNCLIEIELYTGEYVTVNNCLGIDSDIQTDADNLDCSTPIQQNSLFSESEWENAAYGHPSFKCATTPTNSIAVRTTLPMKKNDILILLYKRSNTIDQIKIYPSDNYALDSMQDVDKSLCGSYNRTDVPKIEPETIKIDPKIITKCNNVLIDSCTKMTFINTKQNFLTGRVNKLIQDCALDAQSGVEPIGLFQKDIFEPTIYEELIKHFKNSECDNDLCLNGEILALLKKFCGCKGKTPNKTCLIEKKCEKSFKLCL